MLLDTNLNDEQNRYAVTIKAGGESLLALIDDILDFSKIEAGKMSLENINFDPEVLRSTYFSACIYTEPVPYQVSQTGIVQL